MLQGCEMGLCVGSSWGERLPERSQKLSHKQSCDPTGSGLTGLEVVLSVGTDKQCSTLSVPDLLPCHLCNTGRCLWHFLSLSYDYDPMSYYKLFHQAMDLLVLYSEQALSTVMKQDRWIYWTLLPLTSSITFLFLLDFRHPITALVWCQSTTLKSGLPESYHS